MTAAQVIEKQVLIDTLLAIEEPLGVYPVRALVLLSGTTDQYKVFWEHVPDNVELPYIVISHITGGRHTGTSVSQGYSETTWKIVLHTADMTLTETGANVIGLLANRCPVTTSYPTVYPVTTIQEVMPVFDRYAVQNVPQFMVGGLYTLYLNLGET